MTLSIRHLLIYWPWRHMASHQGIHIMHFTVLHNALPWNSIKFHSYNVSPFAECCVIRAYIVIVSLILAYTYVSMIRTIWNISVHPLHWMWIHWIFVIHLFYHRRTHRQLGIKVAYLDFVVFGWEAGLKGGYLTIPGIIMAYIQWRYATMIPGWRYAFMISENVLMMEIHHMPKVCSNKLISIWACGNMNTNLNYENIRQT